VNCPRCAESYGWRQVLQHRPCRFCRSPVELDARGRLRSFASEHAQEVLDRPRGWRYWALFVTATGATLAISILPSAGLLPLLLLPIIQMFSMERATVRYKEHFGWLHGLVNDFYSTLAFLAFVLGCAALNAVAPGLSGPLSALLFVIYWFFHDAYCRRHFRQIAAHQRPSILELAGVIGTFSVVLLPPLVLLAAVLWSYYGVPLETAGG
jgi:hypothetical protein